ncbi:acetyl-CoA C-acyltransferase [Flavobacteriaceae bacterium]|jgi:acetyl-CoA acyltransferase|nr:acetyl-CoA C-acyltransferase [Flavobacteriaceae bacterium]MBT5694386.1 acetyl-CoA C-acyltransferase [Flavobacteriaceae bacterium]MDA7698741.1 acetyl-CoA C-acyltransferase [Flavobacteriaceae bacterium]MDB2695509.1 acetyl-CoA C-acyltransferase [Flavobacteriaceae bacterium]MDC3215238.1 acetyl-CoA C-acyltransferase [Flavobacteriaceae bacterium]|tara:strand:+ start:7290 stop:8459 length:1170 start_codon:yes stop_codon:yes gene_type:complete
MEAYIIKGYRSAVGKANKGGFKNYRSDDLAVEVIKHLMAAVPEVDPKSIDDVIVGCANPEGEQGLQVGRLIAARALGKEVPGITINRYCASGLEAISQAVAKINAGFGHIYLAGGAESMSMIPMTGYKLAPSYKANLENLNYHVGMGATAEAVAAKYGITREAADLFSFESHNKAAAAIDGGKFNDQIVPIEVEEVFVADGKRATKTHTVSMDEGVRRETSLEGLAKLRPAFKVKGVVTAGNASQTSDGAAFTLVVSETMVKQLNLKPIARLAACAVGGVDPLYMGIGPCIAIPKALKQAGLQLSDIEQTELNEAFGAQALAVIQEAGLNPETVNVNGGAIALGHPLGCTGAKLTIQLLDEMQRRKQRYGMVTACVGGGQGIAGIFERL